MWLFGHSDRLLTFISVELMMEINYKLSDDHNNKYITHFDMLKISDTDVW